MRGTNASTGKHLADIAHLRQSVRDILTTPLGSRVMRREYGSRLLELVDNPINPTTMLEAYAATAEALMRWEPRLKVLQVRATAADSGSLTVELDAEYLPDGKKITIDGIVIK